MNDDKDIFDLENIEFEETPIDFNRTKRSGVVAGKLRLSQKESNIFSFFNIKDELNIDEISIGYKRKYKEWLNRPAIHVAICGLVKMGLITRIATGTYKIFKEE